MFVDHARRLAAGVANLSYVVGSGTALPFDDGAFDAVIFHTVLSHIPDAGAALAEAARVTAAGGALAVFDGDYATTTVAVGDHDPLQACADAAMAALVHDRYLVRRLGTLVRAAGWDIVRLRSHGYVENEEPGYILTLIDRGADTLVGAGRLGRAGGGCAEGRGAPAGGGGRVLRPHRLREPDRPASVGCSPMRTRVSGGLVTNDVQARLRAYARLLVRAGVNLTEGQELLVHGQVEHAPFVRAIAEEAYAAGARYVDASYADRRVQRAFVTSAADDMLGWTPPWMVQRLERAIEVGAAVIGISADSGAEVFEGVDGDRLARARYRDFDLVWMDGVMGRKLAWSLVAYPTEGWAREALGEPDLDRLWDAFAHALRLDEPDPAGSWRQRLDELEARARELTERAFTALRYRGPGTDLEVGLIEGARWMAGRERTVHGQVHAPNLPTEEVFTSPHRLRADGTVRSTMPLALRGTIVEGLELRVAGGEIVEARSTRGEDALRAELAIDEGARHFGEVALVDASSRVGETGVTFNNTLFDENAAAHIAWGRAIPWALDHLPADQHAAAGLNDSATHTDFMVGAPEVEIDGVEPGGTAVALLRDGVWQL